MTGSVVLLSGGIDSTTALAWTNHSGSVGVCVTVDYGQRHRREIDAAREVAARYGVEHLVLDFRSFGAALPGSALTDPGVDVPAVGYDSGSMAVTVVPNRNAVFVMAAAGIAAARGLGVVVVAVHAGDHDLYPDCRPEFVEAVSVASFLGCGVTVRAPLQDLTKTDIVRAGDALGAPLWLTWSCYNGGVRHCGRCGTCIERADAFRGAGVTDPTEYESQE